MHCYPFLCGRQQGLAAPKPPPQGAAVQLGVMPAGPPLARGLACALPLLASGCWVEVVLQVEAPQEAAQEAWLAEAPPGAPQLLAGHPAKGFPPPPLRTPPPPPPLPPALWQLAGPLPVRPWAQQLPVARAWWPLPPVLALPSPAQVGLGHVEPPCLVYSSVQPQLSVPQGLASPPPQQAAAAPPSSRESASWRSALPVVLGPPWPQELQLLARLPMSSRTTRSPRGFALAAPWRPSCRQPSAPAVLGAARPCQAPLAPEPLPAAASLWGWARSAPGSWVPLRPGWS